MSACFTNMASYSRLHITWLLTVVDLPFMESVSFFINSLYLEIKTFPNHKGELSVNYIVKKGGGLVCYWLIYIKKIKLGTFSWFTNWLPESSKLQIKHAVLSSFYISILLPFLRYCKLLQREYINRIQIAQNVAICLVFMFEAFWPQVFL